MDTIYEIVQYVHTVQVKYSILVPYFTTVLYPFIIGLQHSKHDGITVQERTPLWLRYWQMAHPDRSCVAARGNTYGSLRETMDRESHYSRMLVADLGRSHLMQDCPFLDCTRAV